MTIVAACGLKVEARLIAASGSDILPVVGGGNAAHLEAELDAAVARVRPTLILSSGIAGALHPALKAGATVLDGDANLVERLRQRLPDATVGPIVGQASICATSAAKRALRESMGAIAVDMETHIARRVAARNSLPFVALRIISDGSDVDLPPATLVGMRPDGSMALGPVLLSLARQPGQLLALMRAGREAKQAFYALGRAHDLLGGAWTGFADFRQFPLDMG